ncbi:MAG: rRNA ((527)-N(7))-methyltransferase GidB [Pseudomonadota bacterium]
MPPEVEVLRAGGRALGLELDDAVVDRLLRFGALLAKWNATHNLTAIRSADELLTHHLLDSLSLAAPLARWMRAGDGRVLDVGAGGGLPGIPLAILRPDLQFTLVDAVQKKVAFLRQAQLEIGLTNLTPVHGRIEALALQPFPVVTSRAFAALPKFCELTRHLLAPGGVWLAMKGLRPDEELAGMPTWAEVLAVEPLVVPGLEETRHLVVARVRPEG